MRQFSGKYYYCYSHINEHYWMQRQLITVCITTLEKVFNYFWCTLLHSASLVECVKADKINAGRELGKLWSHCLMAIVAGGQMVFPEGRAALRTAVAEVTSCFMYLLIYFSKWSMSLAVECKHNKRYKSVDMGIRFSRLNAG